MVPVNAVRHCNRDQLERLEMADWLLDHEGGLRLAAFIGTFALVALWETFAPARTLLLERSQRWTRNLGVAALNILLLRLLLPAAAVGMAAFALHQGFGLFRLVELPYTVSILLALLALDFAIYLQHVLFHHVPALWRLHRVHHADLDFDVTTGVRFHPLEVLLSMAFKFAVIVVLGPPVISVLVFELLLSTTSLFNHANATLPPRWDRITRWLLVTPDMHRIHHSVLERERNSNFGFCLPWWDRVFGTYRGDSAVGQRLMTIGLGDERDPQRCSTLTGILAMPFTKISTVAEWRSVRISP